MGPRKSSVESTASVSSASLKLIYAQRSFNAGYGQATIDAPSSV